MFQEGHEVKLPETTLLSVNDAFAEKMSQM
jgi:hypothetical protein